MSTEHGDLPARTRRGRRPGTSRSREAILEAARTRFAEHGYTAATIRTIAADAGVDPALVMQFFGSKEELFAAVMSIPPSALSRIAEAFDGPESSLGERVTRVLLGTWEGDPQQSEPLLAMLRGAIAREQANAQLSEFIQARITTGISARSRDGDTVFRIGLASSMLLGVVVGRRIVGVPALADEDIESIVAAVAPALQQILSPPG